MAESTSDAATNKGDDLLPQVPECDVTQDDAGTYHLTHRGSGDTETAETPEQVELRGMMLRISAAITREPPFTTGDMP